MYDAVLLSEDYRELRFYMYNCTYIVHVWFTVSGFYKQR